MERLGERLGIKADFLAALADEIRTAERRLGQGRAQDYAAYLAAVEQIRAFERCGSIFERVYRQYLEDEDEDDS